MPILSLRAVLLSVLMLVPAACGRQPSAAMAAVPAPAPTLKPLPRSAPGCLPTHDGFLRARLRGAINLDIDWRDADMQCDGGVRPDGNGERVTFAGPVPGSAQRVRFVFGISVGAAQPVAHGLPTNVTVIIEGQQKLYATRGDDKCTVDEFRQETSTAGGPHRRRASARGFCIAPAASLAGDGSVLLTRFDFAGPILDEDH